jgi:hypothetical protein
MTTLVDLRRWRIEADPVRLDQLDVPCTPPRPAPPGMPDGAEIILFPRIGAVLLRRPRRSLKRRFARHGPADAAGD